MSTRVAINGFGRTGRMVLRALVESERDDIVVVGINDLAGADRLAHLLKYDSVHGRFPGTVSSTDESIVINGTFIPVLTERESENLPWDSLGVDIILECTGFFLAQDLCGKHIMAGAKKVLLSAPAKDDNKKIVYGVNDNIIDASDVFVSHASFKTNALAPLLFVLDKHYGVKSGIMTTMHACTGDQPTHDSHHRDPYRGRAAALSMVPTTTGAAKAIDKVLPALDGKLQGTAIRVPVPKVSAVDLTVIAEKTALTEDVRSHVKTASEAELKGVLVYVDEKVVSSDLNHHPHSSNFVANQVYTSENNLIRIMAWYDNECGFSNRMLDTGAVMGRFR